ncbi:MAG: transporter [Thermoleophilia bacterium]|nr:transporter [Thermoleophilia bacterium]
MTQLASRNGSSAVATPPPANQEHRRPGLALAVICIAQLMIVLDATVVNVALPSIHKDLGFSSAGLTWVITSYSLAFGGLLLFGGRTGDLYGRRRMFMVGVGLFAVASLAGGLAQNEAWLVIARAVQGAGGAIAAPTALALIATTFTEGDERNRAFGVYATMAASGAALGLILGGVLTDLASWRWSLLINVPIGAAVLLLAPRVLGESQGNGTKLDVPGALTATAGMASLVYGFSNAATHSWSSTGTVVALVASVVLLAAFVVIELNTEAPLMPLRIFRSRNRSGAYLTMLCLAAALFTTFFFTSQYLDIAHGWSPLKTGMAFLPMPIMIMFMSLVVVRRLIPKVGAKPFLTVGPISAIGAMVVFSTIDASSSYLHLMGGLLLLGFGMGCSFVPLTMSAVAGVHAHETGLASALLNTGQQLGGAVGLSVLGTIGAHAAKDRAAHLGGPSGAGKHALHVFDADVFVHGQHSAFIGGAIVAGLALVASLALIRTVRRAPATAPATAET